MVLLNVFILSGKQTADSFVDVDVAPHYLRLLHSSLLLSVLHICTKLGVEHHTERS